MLRTTQGAVRLVEVTGQATAAGDTFRLRFRSLDGRHLPGQLSVRHPRLGPVPFFVTTSGPRATAVVDGRKG